VSVCESPPRSFGCDSTESNGGSIWIYFQGGTADGGARAGAPRAREEASSRRLGRARAGRPRVLNYSGDVRPPTAVAGTRESVHGETRSPLRSRDALGCLASSMYRGAMSSWGVSGVVRRDVRVLRSAAAALMAPRVHRSLPHAPCRAMCSASAVAPGDQPWTELKRQFDDDGYCVVNNVLSDELRAAIDRFSTAETEQMTPEQQEEHKFTGSLIPIVDPVFQPLLTNPALMEALESLGFGTDIKWSCGFIISKPPGGPSLAWQ
jgi:hypothetical protein